MCRTKELKRIESYILEVNEMNTSITIPKEEYNTLIGFKRIVEIEYGRSLSKALLKELEEAQRDIKSGKGVALHSRKEIQKYFESM